MKYVQEDFPHLEFSDTYNTVDSSKLTTYERCPRKFLFEYIFGFRSIYPNKHLIYGIALHTLLEYLLLQPYEEMIDQEKRNVHIMKAYELALADYREHFSVEADEYNKPKSPEYFIPSAIAYIRQYLEEWRTEELVATEIYGKVPIDEEGREMTYRIDAVRRNQKGQLYGLEHKSGSQAGPAWYDKWILAMQPLVYYHSLRFNYMDEDVYGMVINGVIAAKRKNVTLDAINLHRVPVRYSDNQMVDLLGDVVSIYKRLEEDMERLSSVTPADSCLGCFHRNTEACTDYNTTCMYHTICATTPNPVKEFRDGYIPEGFKVEHWNPLAEATNEVV